MALESVRDCSIDGVAQVNTFLAGLPRSSHEYLGTSQAFSMHMIPLTAREPLQGIWGGRRRILASGWGNGANVVSTNTPDSELEEAPPIYSSRHILNECCFVRLCPCRSTRPLSTHCSRLYGLNPATLGHLCLTL